MPLPTKGKLTADLKSVIKGDKVCYVDIFVYKAVSSDAFVVGDSSDAIVLDLSAKPEFSKDVALLLQANFFVYPSQ